VQALRLAQQEASDAETSLRTRPKRGSERCGSWFNHQTGRFNHENVGLTIKNRDFTMKDDGKMWVQALYTWPLNAHFLAAIEYWWIISWNVILQSLSKETVRTTTVKNVIMMGMDPLSTSIYLICPKNCWDSLGICVFYRCNSYGKQG